MSERTTALLLSTFGPLDPSPGKGPAVSSGISLDVLPAVVEPDAVVDGIAELEFDALVGAVDAPALESSPPPQATSRVVRPAPANRPSARRRFISLGRSKSSPRSWSWIRWSISFSMPPAHSLHRILAAATPGNFLGIGNASRERRRRLLQPV